MNQILLQGGVKEQEEMEVNIKIELKSQAGKEEQRLNKILEVKMQQRLKIRCVLWERKNRHIQKQC